MLLDIKLSLYHYLKRLFVEAGKSGYLSVQGNMHPSTVNISAFRPNKVSDIAKLWLQVMQPWRQNSDFLAMVQQLDQTTNLFDEKGNMNIDAFTYLTHTSISSMTTPFDFFSNFANEEERQKERELWIGYVKEMSIFYFDLFVEYV